MLIDATGMFVFFSAITLSWSVMALLKQAAAMDTRLNIRLGSPASGYTLLAAVSNGDHMPDNRGNLEPLRVLERQAKIMPSLKRTDAWRLQMAAAVAAARADGVSSEELARFEYMLIG